MSLYSQLCPAFLHLAQIGEVSSHYRGDRDLSALGRKRQRTSSALTCTVLMQTGETAKSDHEVCRSARDTYNEKRIASDIILIKTIPSVWSLGVFEIPGQSILRKKSSRSLSGIFSRQIPTSTELCSSLETHSQMNHVSWTPTLALPSIGFTEEANATVLYSADRGVNRADQIIRERHAAHDTGQQSTAGEHRHHAETRTLEPAQQQEQRQREGNDQRHQQQLVSEGGDDAITRERQTQRSSTAGEQQGVGSSSRVAQDPRGSQDITAASGVFMCVCM